MPPCSPWPRGAHKQPQYPRRLRIGVVTFDAAMVLGQHEAGEGR
jgi:hypothetical protein